MDRVELIRAVMDVLERPAHVAEAAAALDLILEEAARVADAHKGAAERQRKERGIRLSKLPAHEQEAITAEERGEDIASEMISAAIRALKGTDQ
jgi:2-oxo-4-hydroxy-4-carboxy--5-ureidoimidazoline (OHCU) decarboxylase